MLKNPGNHKSIPARSLEILKLLCKSLQNSLKSSKNLKNPLKILKNPFKKSSKILKYLDNI